MTTTDKSTIQTEWLISQEGIIVSVYDLELDPGCELINEYGHTWSELGLTLHSQANAVESHRIVIRPNGELKIKEESGL